MGNISLHGRPAEERTGAQKIEYRGDKMYIGGREVQKYWIPPYLRCNTDSADKTDLCRGANDMVGTSKTYLDTQKTRRQESKELSESEESSDDDERKQESSPANLSKDLMLTDTDTDKEMNVSDEYFSRPESSSSSSESSSLESTSNSDLSSSADFLEVSAIPTDEGIHLLGRRSEYKKYFYPDGAPKSGRTAFAFFCQEVLGSEGQIKTMREASDVWKNVSKDRANFFKTKEINDFKRVAEETAEYEKTRDINLAEEIKREMLKLRRENKKLFLQFILAEFPYANKKFMRKSTLEVQLMLLRFFNESMRKKDQELAIFGPIKRSMEHPTKTQKKKTSGKATPVSVQSKPAFKKDSRKPGPVSSKPSPGPTRPGQETRKREPGSCKPGTSFGKQGPVPCKLKQVSGKPGPLSGKPRPVSDKPKQVSGKPLPVSGKLKQVSGMAKASILFSTQRPESMKLGAGSLKSGKSSAKPNPASGKLNSNRPGPKSRKSGQKSSKPSPGSCKPVAESGKAKPKGDPRGLGSELNLSTSELALLNQSKSELDLYSSEPTLSTSEVVLHSSVL